MGTERLQSPAARWPRGGPSTIGPVPPSGPPALALQRAAGNRAAVSVMRAADGDGLARLTGTPAGLVQREPEQATPAPRTTGTEVVQREPGDGQAQTAETWSEWAWRNRWKIGLGVAAAAAAGIAYYAYTKGSAPDVKMSEVPSGSGTLTGGGVPTSTVPSATPQVSPTVTSPAPLTGPDVGGGHAWPLGQPYTVGDKLEGLISLLPGGGAAVNCLKMIKDPSIANQEQLIAELAKLASGPYGAVAATWDNVAVALSYYSSGRIEIGTTVDLLRTAGNGMANFEQATGMPAVMLSNM